MTNNNKIFLKLELIKESVLQIFRHQSAQEAEEPFAKAGKWITEAGLPSLKCWFKHLEARWEMVAGYYASPVTGALSEGVKYRIMQL